VASAASSRAPTVPTSSDSARRQPVGIRPRVGARGCGACRWVLWPVRVALLWVLGVADPATLAAVQEAGAAIVPALEGWRPPHAKATQGLLTKDLTKEDADEEI
jgi:hypothetical protein